MRLRYTWSTDARPNEIQISTPPWLDWNGRYLVEGDSNIQLMDVRKFIDPNCFNIGRGGDVPQGVIDQFPEVKKHNQTYEIEKAYIQIGTNLWSTMNPLEILSWEYDTFIRQMSLIITLYKTIMQPENIVIGSLPYINPYYKITDLPGWKERFPIFYDMFKKVKLNDSLMIANSKLNDLCRYHGVHYLDIFSILKMAWDNGYSQFLWWASQKYWWDDVHYDTKAQYYIGAAVRAKWGI